MCARTTLHYLDGHITAELLLPLSAIAGGVSADTLRGAFRRATSGDPLFADIGQTFH
jgi:hypothetical protein